MNSSNPISAAAVLEDIFDFLTQGLSLYGPGGFCPFSPFVESAFTHFEHAQHDLEVEFFAVLVNEFESHLLSLAKKRPSP